MAASSANSRASPACRAKDVYLTIDRELQRFAYEALKDQSAACAVMDVQTGDVLALVSTPGFDPNAVQCRPHAGAVEGV